MDLRLCPACGQSVLDDDAVVCPFCGGAMDGSDKGRVTARPSSVPGRRAAPPQNIPPARSTPGRDAGRTSGGSQDAVSSQKTPAAKPAAKPVQSGFSAGKPLADEDDPFDLGSRIEQKDVIQVLSKPEKGRLHRVVCPMCEHAGFVAKSAIGRQARCANNKCMVPIFTIPDPNAPVADTSMPRKPGARQTVVPSAESRVSRRNPLVIYGIAGTVLLGVVIGLSKYLNQPLTQPGLDAPVPRPAGSSGGVAETEDPAATEKVPAAEAPKTPTSEADRIVKRMVSVARHASNRDKAVARRLTGDVYLRLKQPELAAQEFSQLLTINRQAAYFQIVPRIQDGWRNASRLSAADLDQLLKDAAGIPESGRIALETVMALAAGLCSAGRIEEADKLIARYRRDRSVDQDRDAMSCATWYLSTSVLHDAGLLPLAVMDVYSWNDALPTGVAVSLAAHGDYSSAVSWCTRQAEKEAAADSLAAVAEIAAVRNAAAADLDLIESAADAVHEIVGVRIRSLIATQKKDSGRLEVCHAKLQSVTIPGRQSLADSAAVMNGSLPERSVLRQIAAAATELSRAAVACGDVVRAEDGVRMLTASILAIAPSVAETRVVSRDIQTTPDAVRKRLQDQLRISSSTELESAFRNYRRRIDRCSMVAEEERLSLIQKLARILRAGGAAAVRPVFVDVQSGLKAELMVDYTPGILSVAAMKSGKPFPEAAQMDESSNLASSERSGELPETRVIPLIVKAWSSLNDDQFSDVMKAVEGASLLPGFREVALQEIVMAMAGNARQPAPVYRAVASLNNALWREELYQTAGRILAARGLQEAAEKWLDDEVRAIPPTEQAAALYGIAAGILQLAADTTADTATVTPSVSNGAAAGK